MTNTTNTPELPALPTSTITGYQWGALGVYIGSYDFPRNQDQESIHLPHNTTLVPPPTVIPAGKQAVWAGPNDKWLLQDLPNV
jgi:hypothetical protein